MGHLLDSGITVNINTALSSQILKLQSDSHLAKREVRAQCCCYSPQSDDEPYLYYANYAFYTGLDSGR